MSYYRIKIEELKNGETRYVPQKGYLVTTRSFLQSRSNIRWENLFCGSFSSESLALEKIEFDKIYEERKNGKEIVTTTFKIID
jgi:hypothetical protein